MGVFGEGPGDADTNLANPEEGICDDEWPLVLIVSKAGRWFHHPLVVINGLHDETKSRRFGV